MGERYVYDGYNMPKRVEGVAGQATQAARDDNVHTPARGMVSLQYLMVRAYNHSVKAGFTDASFGERIALCHSELSEALEAFRTYADPLYVWHSGASVLKPEGVPAELADTIIRILDMCEHYGIDIERAILEKMDYNETRPYRHGGKSL